jgi:organic hydroperoxide reductase OsmC/OhrA
MAHTHSYNAKVTWSGAAQGPTVSYQSYSREYLAEIPGKPALRGSADATFRGDPALHNPEDLLVVALSTCHMLSYLADCARTGVKVVAYEDQATGTMAIRDRKMGFTEVVLRPRVVISADSDADKAMTLHRQAHEECFIANSVNFPVHHEAVVTREGGARA